MVVLVCLRQNNTVDSCGGHCKAYLGNIVPRLSTFASVFIRPVVTEFDVKLALVDEDRRKAVYQDVIDMLEPINSVVFVCTKGWNRADLCRGFIQSLSVEDPLLIRYRLIHFVEIPSFCYKLQPQRALFNW